jgi:subtilisin family serine protease
MMRRYIILREPGRTQPEQGQRPVFYGPGVSPSLEQTLLCADLTPGEAFDAGRDPTVRAFAPVMPVQLIRPVPRDPMEGAAAWGLKQIGADRSRFDGGGITVAVLDSGIDAGHPAFRGVQLEQRDFSGSGNGDRLGHGTHCAGIIFGREVDGRRIGVAPGITHALIGKVTADDGTGSSEALFRAIGWAVEQGARILSMSITLDFVGQVKQLTDNEEWPIELATASALETYRANVRLFDTLMANICARAPFGGDCIVVAASGNDSRRDVNSKFRVAAALPAAAAGVIAVGALERVGDKLAIASFSNTLPTLCAPGVNIFSAKAGGGLVALSGTSSAAPHVAGVAALWWQSLRTLPGPLQAESVAAKLKGTARTDGFAPGVEAADCGMGLVRVP